MTENAKQRFWDRYFLTPVKTQLTQGVTPTKIALTCAIGVTLGIFPILGTTTMLCLIAGLALRLNQPILQSVNYLIYPVQLALFPVFVKAGEKLFQAPPITFVPTTLVKEFAAGPGPFMAKYGMAGLHGIVVWLLITPILMVILYFPLTALFKRMNGQRIS